MADTERLEERFEEEGDHIKEMIVMTKNQQVEIDRMRHELDKLRDNISPECEAP